MPKKKGRKHKKKDEAPKTPASASRPGPPTGPPPPPSPVDPKDLEEEWMAGLEAFSGGSTPAPPESGAEARPPADAAIRGEPAPLHPPRPRRDRSFASTPSRVVAIGLVLLLAGLVAYAAWRIGGEELPEDVAIEYLEAIFPRRVQQAIHRGAIFVAYVQAPADESQALPFPELLERLRDFTLDRTVVARVEREESLASVRVLLVYSDQSIEEVEVGLSLVAGRWRILREAALGLRFGWETEVDRRIGGLRALEVACGTRDRP